MTNPNQQTNTPAYEFDVDPFEYGVYSSREIAATNIGVIGLSTIPVITKADIPPPDAYTVRFDQ